MPSKYVMAGFFFFIKLERFYIVNILFTLQLFGGEIWERPTFTF